MSRRWITANSTSCASASSASSDTAWISTGSTSFRMCCRRIERTYASAKLPIPHLLGDLRTGIQPGGGQLSVVRDAELVHLNLRNLGDSLQQRGQILREIGRVGLRVQDGGGVGNHQVQEAVELKDRFRFLAYFATPKTESKTGRVVIALILVILTFFTSIFPIISFAFETFLPNPGDYSKLNTGDASNLTTKWWVTAENVTENGMYGQKGILYNETIWRAFKGTILVSVACALLAGSIGTMIGYAVSKNRRSRWANYVNSVAFLPYLMPSIAVGVAFFILFSTEKLNLFNTYTLLIIVGTVKYIPFASRSSLNSMLQLSGEIEEAAIIQDIPWIKRMTRIIIPIQKSSIISGFLLPFMTCLRELSLFMLLFVQGFILSTTLDYFDEMGLYAFSSAINLILIVTILIFNTLVNKLTGASLDDGIGGN